MKKRIVSLLSIACLTLSLSFIKANITKADTGNTTPPTQTELTQLQSMTLAQLQTNAKPMPSAALENDLGTIGLGDWSYIPQDGQIYFIDTKLKNFDEITYYKFLYATPLKNDSSNNIQIFVYEWDYANGVYQSKYSGVSNETGKDLTGRYASSSTTEINTSNSSQSSNQTPSNSTSTPSSNDNNSSSIDSSNNSSVNNSNVKKYKEERIYGANRSETAVRIAEYLYPSAIENVVLTTGDNFPDALTGSVLANSLNAPILLADKYDNSTTLDYISSHLNKNGTIYILGGTGVVNDSIVSNLGYKIVRLSGTDRYDTNVAINEALNVKQGTPIILAAGNGFADALSISSIAAIKGYPIVLTDTNTLPNQEMAYISSIKPTGVFIVGGTGAISDNVKNEVESLTGLSDNNITRIAGIDRFDTSIQIAKYFSLNTDTVTFATGSDFPDALAGSVLAAKNNASVILLSNDATKQKSYIDSIKATKEFLFGGTGAISSTIENILNQ